MELVIGQTGTTWSDIFSNTRVVRLVSQSGGGNKKTHTQYVKTRAQRKRESLIYGICMRKGKREKISDSNTSILALVLVKEAMEYFYMLSPLDFKVYYTLSIQINI